MEIRSFIAIKLPDELKRELGRLQARLKKEEPPGVKWVDPNGIHLTLKFLGDVEENWLSEITDAIKTAVQGTPPFNLVVKELGVFPNLKRVQVVWVGMSGEVDKLGQLQQRLESKLAPLGFAPETRPFVPHLTLARLRDQTSMAERERFGQVITKTKFESAYPIKVETISLMKSELTREGAIYSLISSVGLEKPLSTTTA